MPIDQSDKILKELLTKEGVPVWSIRTPFPWELEGTE